jgi:hypothetical protein
LVVWAHRGLPLGAVRFWSLRKASEEKEKTPLAVVVPFSKAYWLVGCR